MRKLYLSLLICLLNHLLSAQGVCDLTTGVEKGGFTFSTPSAGCHPLNVTIIDKSEGKDVKYILNYKGEPASKLPSLPSTTNLSNTFTNFTSNVLSYTILQYGTKNGKPMYFCNTVTIRKDNTPAIAYESCNNNTLKLIILNSPANNFDSYKITWPNSAVSTIAGNTPLPYSETKSLANSPTHTVLIEGIYNTPTSCPNATPLTVAMDRGANFPRIEKIDLDESGEKATITLKGNPATTYYLAKRTIDQPGILPNNTMPTMKDGSFTIDLIDPTKVNCFSVGTVGTLCQQVSNEVCTRPFTLSPQGLEYKLEWKPVLTGKIQNTGVYTHIANVSTELKREEEGLTATTLSNNPNSPYLDNTADCSKKYCYTLNTSINSSYAGYTDARYIETAIVSQTKCINKDAFHPPAITDAFVSVDNITNHVKIQLTDNSNWNLNPKQFLYYKSENGTDTQLNSAPTISTSFTHTGIDASQQSFCYKVGYKDKCASTSILSPEFCSVFLTENASGQLEWSKKSPFASTAISSYEIQSYDETTNLPSTVSSTIPNQTFYLPNLSSFQSYGKFRIRAIGTGGKESFSNIFSIPIKAQLFVPDVFSPNADGINSTFKIFGTLTNYAEFRMNIYNRRGILVFTTNDPTKLWDGTMNGNEVPIDTYSYDIYIKLKNGQEARKIGYVLLIR